MAASLHYKVSSPKTLAWVQAFWTIGSVPEWLMGTGCKPVGESLRRFESYPAQYETSHSAASSRKLLYKAILYRPVRPSVAGGVLALRSTGTDA